MCKPIALGVRQNRLNDLLGEPKLLCDFGYTQTVVEVVDNRVRWHACATQHRSATEHSRINFDHHTFGPIDYFSLGHSQLLDGPKLCDDSTSYIVLQKRSGASQKARRWNMAIDWSECPVIERVPGKVSGAWVFKGTRMPVATVFENLEDGMSFEELMEQFPVTRDQIKAVLEFAARSLDVPVAR